MVVRGTRITLVSPTSCRSRTPAWQSAPSREATPTGSATLPERLLPSGRCPTRKEGAGQHGSSVYGSGCYAHVVQQYLAQGLTDPQEPVPQGAGSVREWPYGEAWHSRSRSIEKV